MNNLYCKFLKIYIEKLKYFNYSKRTVKIYSHYFEKFLKEVNKYPQHVTSKDFENYLLNFNFSSVSQQNQIINSLKFGYEKVLNKKYNKIDFERPKNDKKLPKIIDIDFTLSKIAKIDNLKHKAIISLALSVGLRVSEVCNLKIKDIDSKRMIIFINQSKGRKDRIVPLSVNILNLLRKYYLKYLPKEYLFNGQKSLQYSPSSCNKIVKKYLGEEFHFHLLRHSSFTHLTDQGADIHAIQQLAGHTSSKTTEIYLHMSSKTLNKLPLAL